ncbi:hypothetical protein ACJ7Z2_07410 [Mannheimia glucosida]|uniref:hypothetical protein n=1 Tax=Mannheimia glucosida TaxID=85401 RepID=UPI003917D3CF
MSMTPRRQNCWIVTGKDENGILQKCRYLYYSRREAVKRFREQFNCVGKHGVIESVTPQFGWY